MERLKTFEGLKHGDKEVGEIDKEFFQLTDQEVKTLVETLAEKNMFLSGQDNGTDDYIKEHI